MKRPLLPGLFLVPFLSLVFIACKKNSGSFDVKSQNLKNQILSVLKPQKKSDSLLNELDLANIRYDKWLSNDVVAVPCISGQLLF